jgi:hypothetical protein
MSGFFIKVKIWRFLMYSIMSRWKRLWEGTKDGLFKTKIQIVLQSHCTVKLLN